jgi:hypothetical protein
MKHEKPWAAIPGGLLQKLDSLFNLVPIDRSAIMAG